MENQLLPSNTTLAGLRRLRVALRKKVGKEPPITIGVTIWQYDDGRIVERIEVYYGGTGEGTQEFNSLKEAHAYVRSIGKEETDATK